jgi:hypothetical protein
MESWFLKRYKVLNPKASKATLYQHENQQNNSMEEEEKGKKVKEGVGGPAHQLAHILSLFPSLSPLLSCCFLSLLPLFSRGFFLSPSTPPHHSAAAPNLPPPALPLSLYPVADLARQWRHLRVLGRLDA